MTLYVYICDDNSQDKKWIEKELKNVKIFDYASNGIFAQELRVIYKDGVSWRYENVRRVIVEE